MIESLRKIKSYINNKIFYSYRITKTFFLPKFNYSKWKGELFVYHGSLIEGDVQYADKRFIGFSLCHPIHSKDVKLSSTTKFPLPDNSIDAFQTEDVMEHIPYEQIIDFLDEVYRILKPGCLFRLSMPDYQSTRHMQRCVYDFKGNIIADVSMGGVAYGDYGGNEIKVKFGLKSTEAHLWFPTYEVLNKLFENSKFKNASSIEWIQANIKNKTPIVKNIPYMNVFNVKRSISPSPDKVEEPISLVVDIIK